MNLKKLPLISKKALTGILMASIVFVNILIVPRIAFGQTQSSGYDAPSGGQINVPGVTNYGVPLSGYDTPSGGEINVPGITGQGNTSTQSGSGPDGSLFPEGLQGTTVPTNDPIGFRNEANGGFSHLDQNGVRQYVGGSGSAQSSSLTGGGTAGPSTSISAGGTIGGALQCSAAGVLGQVLATSIRSAITNLIGSTIKNAALGVLGLGPVPVDVKGSVADHIVGDTQARSGSFTWGSIFTGVSWDSIAWCIVNSMIEQIANSTIAWANSGFNGSPAFIQNPERFFSDIADQTAGSIIKDIAYGGTGINVCQPFRVNIAIGLAQNYQGQQTPLRGLSCRLSDITSQKFFGGVTTSVGGSRVSTAQRPGNITWDDWIQVSQRDQNNPYGASIMANQLFYSGISQRQNTVQFEVGMNNGWLNFKKCKDPKNPKTCDIVTPGRLIESQLNSTLDQSKNRLVMAQKFDQMVTAIVNNLIKVALNQVLGQ